MAIAFYPNLYHVLGFRHGPRAKRPPAGNVWDLQMGLSEKASAIAQKTIELYLPGLVPAALRCSQIRRSRTTLELLWPSLTGQIVQDDRLGIYGRELPQWEDIDAHANAYDMTPQQQHAILPDLVDTCGWNFLYAAATAAYDAGVGRVGALCSHTPFADAGARLARQRQRVLIMDKTGVDENGWLSGSGFGSGAFVHLAFESSLHGGGVNRSPEDAVRFCDYYPAPEVD